MALGPYLTRAIEVHRNDAKEKRAKADRLILEAEELRFAAEIDDKMAEYIAKRDAMGH